MALRVIPVVIDDVATHVVVVWVNSGHDVKFCIAKDPNPAHDEQGTSRIGVRSIYRRSCPRSAD